MDWNTVNVLAAAVGGEAFWVIIFQLVLLLTVALVIGMAFERLGQSAILGYLLAGTLMGPAVFDVVHADSGVPVLAELGVSMLLFAIGLEFSVSRLLRLGKIAFGGGSLQVLLTLGLATLVALAAGQMLKVSFVVGAMVALSSTACVLRMLVDRGEIDSVHGRSALGILLLQDVAVVPLILLVTMLGGSGSPVEMGMQFLKAVSVIIGLVVSFRLLSNFVLPRVLTALSLSRDRELLILLAVILAFGSASAAHAVDISPALGAFVAGIMLAESPFASQIRSDISALRALFITLFFTSVGMLGDPGWILGHLGPVLIVVVLVMVGKAVLITAIALLFKRPLQYAVATGVTLAQVGEFGVVISGIAHQDGLLDDYVFQLMVSATLISLLLTPFLVRFAVPIGNKVERWLPQWPCFGGVVDREDEVEKLSEHVLVIGFGPSGQEVARELDKQGVPMLVLDLRPANIKLAHSLGYRAELGDATNLDALLHHGVNRASALVITVPDHRASAQIAEAVRNLVPGISIIVRARYHPFVPELKRAGATVVVDEEEVTGKRLSAAVRATMQERS